MYPDIDDNNAPNSGAPNYQATGKNQKDGKKKQANDGSCCGLAAKIWVTIIGLLTLLLGVFVAAISLYAKFGYGKYEDIIESLPSGGIWMIFSFGIILAICSILLVIAAHKSDKGIFIMILVVFSIILTLLLLLEIAGAGVFIWGLGVISLPDNEVGNAISDRILEVRNEAAQVAYDECCPTIGNITTPNQVLPACLWPEAATAVIASCNKEGKQVFDCVCGSVLTYGSSFGLYLQSNLKWVAIVTIVFAVLLLFGLIATCTLICTKDKKKKADKAAMYTN